MTTTDNDRIEKRVVLRAPRARVWRAISDSQQFGLWFGVRFEGAFTAGAHMVGKMTPTIADPEVAKMQKPYEGAVFHCDIETIRPMDLFSFRWHPFAIDPAHDYSAEPKTLVEFLLSDDPAGTLLVIRETGFAGLPESRRAQAFSANEGGWTHQSKLLESYLARER